MKDILSNNLHLEKYGKLLIIVDMIVNKNYKYLIRNYILMHIFVN